jgi:hypothetical protein
MGNRVSDHPCWGVTGRTDGQPSRRERFNYRSELHKLHSFQRFDHFEDGLTRLVLLDGYLGWLMVFLIADKDMVDQRTVRGKATRHKFQTFGVPVFCFFHFLLFLLMCQVLANLRVFWSRGLKPDFCTDTEIPYNR